MGEVKVKKIHGKSGIYCKGGLFKRDGCDGVQSIGKLCPFDAISSEKGGVVSHVVYDDKLASYRDGSDKGSVSGSFARDLNGFLAIKGGAILALICCLLVDFGFVAKVGIDCFL